MTDSTPDDKTLDDEAAAPEETVQDAAEEAENADAVTDSVAEAEAPTKKVSTTKKPSAAKKRPAPPAEDEDEDDDEDEAPVRRRPKAAPRETARTRAAATTAGATVTTVVITVVIVALLAAAITFGVLWGMQKSENDDMKQAAADKAHAEKVASEYATGTATIDFRDLGPWRAALTKGVTPELKAKLDASAGAMTQLLVPLQWVSKGTALDAVVSSQSGSVYKVTAYVKVDGTNIQATTSRDLVTGYEITMDKARDWQITDAGSSLMDSLAPDAGGTTQAPAAPTETAPAPAPAPAPGN
ncbi:hypothetical protein [Tsukamurella paurometabola]|uniref:Mce-associated membrane protein n=1 Tax=Tsukamurella paurometabola TaxID=2061 RepID=A0A3P8KZG1_TSUPA|nr:hypothetical protein [Tsukamurella paurometabola]UEA84567.1 hypothetical protein LK411_07025 [Tsukamurella paurometabola]VDR37135.1 Uncharacterised protein [Tsukamurella paurometabola]